MKLFNWTDCEHPCFEDYKPSFGEGDGPDDCDSFDDDDCDWKQGGGDWQDCKSGRQSKWQDWLPKEGKDE